MLDVGEQHGLGDAEGFHRLRHERARERGEDLLPMSLEPFDDARPQRRRLGRCRDEAQPIALDSEGPA